MSVPELVPARMLNEFAYCPRLAYLEWVDGDWADSADTIEGRHVHRRVDQEGGAVPAADEAGAEQRIHARSVLLSATGVGLVTRIDLIEGEGVDVTPVDYKRGRRPEVPGGAYEPERVQLCAQALVLEENGFRCREGILYFSESRERVAVALDGPLRERTVGLLAAFRQVAEQPTAPPPLVDSPKCPRCSLVGICLPDEVTLLGAGASSTLAAPPRQLLPARDDALPLYVHTQGATVSKSGDCLKVLDRGGSLAEVRLHDVSQLSVFGGVQVTTPAIRAAAERGIPVCYFSQGGWFYAVTAGLSNRNVDLRRRQFAAAESPGRALALARRFVNVKIRNCRTLVRRNHPDVPAEGLRDLRRAAARAWRAVSLEEILGIEGAAARRYYGLFTGMLHAPGSDGAMDFRFEGRNRRPPRDPVNALLSLGYALLAKDIALVLQAVGFDPHLGFYHQPRYGRPALALDIMEEFRPPIVDSVVLGAVNGGIVRSRDFVSRAGAVALSPVGRRKFIEAYERRMDELITHPVFQYRISYRRVLEVQARLLGRHLTGEIEQYPAFVTR